MEMCNTLTDSNDRNNTPLFNANIRESIHEVMEEGSITDANNVTVDIFSHTSSAQRENENAIFTGEKLDKSDELVDAVNNSTINNAKYYESNTATASDSQGNIAYNLETVTHNSTAN